MFLEYGQIQNIYVKSFCNGWFTFRVQRAKIIEMETFQEHVRELFWM